MAGTAEEGEVVLVEDGAASCPGLDLMDVGGDGLVAALAGDGWVEELLDQGDALGAVGGGCLG